MINIEELWNWAVFPMIFRDPMSLCDISAGERVSWPAVIAGDRGIPKGPMMNTQRFNDLNLVTWDDDDDDDDDGDVSFFLGS